MKFPKGIHGTITLPKQDGDYTQAILDKVANLTEGTSGRRWRLTSTDMKYSVEDINDQEVKVDFEIL